MNCITKWRPAVTWCFSYGSLGPLSCKNTVFCVAHCHLVTVARMWYPASKTTLNYYYYYWYFWHFVQYCHAWCLRTDGMKTNLVEIQPWHCKRIKAPVCCVYCCRLSSFLTLACSSCLRLTPDLLTMAIWFCYFPSWPAAKGDYVLLDDVWSGEGFFCLMNNLSKRWVECPQFISSGAGLHRVLITLTTSVVVSVPVKWQHHLLTLQQPQYSQDRGNKW